MCAQSPENALQKFTENYPQEKVVLLLSKTEYLAGETIFFKAYVLTGYEPSLLSTNLYAELYDKEKNLLKKEMIPLLKGSGNGSFVLPASLAEDVYYIRAYTQWMRNFDEAFYYLKSLPVYNPNSLKSLQPMPVQWTARAVVESGQLLDGEPANVVVRLSATGSLPSQWSGQVMEAGSSEPVATLVVYNNEIGQVRFIPNEGKTYRIIVADNTGKTEELVLPLVQKSGILLRAGASAGLLRYNILFKNLPSGGSGYKIIAAFNNELAVSATITKSPGYVNGSFDFKHLSPGVLQLALFNEKDEPVIERLFFLHHDSLPTNQLSLTTDTLSVAAKGYNRWQVSGDSILPETIAVTVADAAHWQPPDFLSAIYLTADFTAPVHNAEWYFTAVNPDKKAALDALLLTEKWNRFQWGNLLQNRFPTVRYKPDSYLTFTGTVTKGKKVQPFREMNLILRGADSSFSIVQVKTDSAGKFILDNFFFTDTLSVFYQAGKRKLLESDPEISFTAENSFAPATIKTWPYSNLLTSTRAKTDSVPVTIKRAMAQRSAERLLAEKVNVLEEVVVSARAKSATEELERKLTSGLFSGGNADVFDFVNENQNNIAGYTNILEWLRGRVPSLTFSNQNGTLVPQIRNGPVQLFLDEMLADADLISSISPFDVAMIKIFRGNFVGSLGAGSAIAIYTRRGGMTTSSGGSSLSSAKLKGYTKFELPYMPNYSSEIVAAQKDERTVLLFNPAALPSEQDTLTIRFYNNDTAQQFRLLVTGFTPDGRLVYINRLLP